MDKFLATAFANNSASGLMQRDQFVSSLLPADNPRNLNANLRKPLELLFDSIKNSNSNSLDFNDYMSFYNNLLLKPDVEDLVLFRLLDRKNTGTIGLDEITPFTKGVSKDLFSLFFGTDPQKKKRFTYNEFTQFLKSFHAERLQQEFKLFDKRKLNVISIEDFKILLKNLSGHRFKDDLWFNQLSKVFTNNLISFPVVNAVYNITRNLDAVELLKTRCLENSTSNGLISKETLFSEALKPGTTTSFTPLEVDIIYKLCSSLDCDTQTTKANGGFLTPLSFDKLIFPSFGLPTAQSLDAKHFHHKSGTEEVINGLYNFGIGSIAGAIGAATVYPIDLVKTRMQNQRSSKFVGQLLYKNSFDCFSKVIKNEGFLGLYSGIIPQLVGVAPEKAIKLAMNDLIRSKVKDDLGNVPLWGSILAGASAGGSQVVFTNPLEIVKIRLQVQGEAFKKGGAPKQSAADVIRSLGLFGLYKGVAACLLRDVPFSAIYFPTYAYLKSGVFEEGKNGKKLAGWELLVSGAIAGIPAAYLVTPADVIKTRLQVAARQGDQTYSGIIDAFRKIMREEGPKAFFKGGIARIFRSSPQFGVTLFCYEKIQGFVPLDRLLGKSDISCPIRLNTDLENRKRVFLRGAVDVMPQLDASRG